MTFNNKLGQMKKIKKNMWVVFARENNGNTLISILSGRTSSSKMKDYVEQMWVDRHLSLEEMISFINRRRHLPFKAEFAGYNNIPFMGRILCGYDGADVYAIHAYSVIYNDDCIVINYRMPSQFDREEFVVTEWKEFTTEIKKT